MPTSTPGILSASIRHVDLATHRTARFVTQSHTLSRPVANPRALVMAAAIAVVLLLLGRRLSA